MKIQFLPAFFLILFLFPFFLDGQNAQLSTSDKTAIRYFNNARELYSNDQIKRALKEIQKALETDSEFVEAYMLQGDLLADNRQPEEAIVSYSQAVQHSKSVNPKLYYVLAKIQLKNGHYRGARNNYTHFIESPGISEQNRKMAIKGMESAIYGEKAMEHPVPFVPVNLGDSINTENDEYINGITADGENLYFTRWIVKGYYLDSEHIDYNEDFYFTRKKDSTWMKAKNLGPPINTGGNEGAMSVSPDGNFIYFAGCSRDDGFGSCDLYRSRRTAVGWSAPENLGDVVNSPQWDTQPSVAADGKTIYFVSKRPGGKGSCDIWMTEQLPDGGWKTPVNLGDSVNTPGEEMAPFIHPDNQTLYFSSNGHPGMGGMDLFVSRKQDNVWQRPVNLGYPINTCYDEITLVVNSGGNFAYISSDKLGGKGKQDIYQFSLYPEIRPQLSTYFKGVVYDVETRKKLEASFELTDLKEQKVVAQAHANPYTGDFLLVLPTDRNYALNVSHPGFLFYSDNFMLSGVNSVSKPFIKDIPLKPIKIGETVVLKNIFFDTDKYTLKKESVIELRKLLALLQQNTTLKIEISGHTDNIGSVQHNQELSLNRSKAVYDYLISNNVQSGRLVYKGYGFQKPVDTNETEEGRANNRRTEFKVIGN